VRQAIDDALRRLDAADDEEALAAIPRGPAPDWEALDGVFWECLVEVWDASRSGRSESLASGSVRRDY